MEIKPLSGYVVIKPFPDKEKTKTGILVPKTAEKERPARGKVIAVGPARKTSSGKTIPPEVKRDDEVIFNKYGPTEIEINGQKHLIVQDKDILAIVIK